MILSSQLALKALLLSPAMQTNVDIVNAKFAADGIAITAPKESTTYLYDDDSLEFDSDWTTTFILTRFSDPVEWPSSDKILLAHTLYVAFLMGDELPEVLQRRKMMIAEAALPLINVGVRDGKKRYDCHIAHVEYMPQFADSALIISDVTITVLIKEYINSQEIDP